MHSVIVPKGRLTTLRVDLGYDISGYTFRSQIRENPKVDSPLIAEWTVSFATDGEDGVLLLTLPGLTTELIEQTEGYMDIKRTSGGDSTTVFDGVLKVLFPEVVTE